MPRKQREKSALGMYHVMLRGINKQNIFIDDDDYLTMVRVLADAHIIKGYNGKIISENECHIIAYAIMPNHVHILIKEEESTVSQVMKKIEDRFVWLYNNKYERTGHLFQDRFRSEAVNDRDYFMQLLRYIHRNPVHAGICKHPEDYLYSSWREYWQEGTNAIIRVCDTSLVYDEITLSELDSWVNLDVSDNCMDMDSERFVLTDRHAWEILKELSGVDTHEDFKQLKPDLQLEYILQAIAKGISIRQASRLSILSFAKIQREISKNSIEKVNQGVRPLDSLNSKEIIDLMEETGKDIEAEVVGITETPGPLGSVFRMLVQHPEGLATKEISETLEFSMYATRKLLDTLCRQGHIMYFGSTKAKLWKITK